MQYEEKALHDDLLIYLNSIGNGYDDTLRSLQDAIATDKEDKDVTSSLAQS